ncbi:MAG: cation transporter [Deltaproteobacteria bacterium]|nr:cation transporter [Deltaproteobacteria bacterium]
MDLSNPKIRAALVSVAAASFLCVIKLAIGLLTGSLAVLSSGIDSLLDIFMSGINFLAIRRAEEPPDKKHPFGHGKFETLATLAQALFISLSGLWVLFEAGRRLLQGFHLRELEGGIGVLLLGTVVSWLISRYLKRVAKETESAALRADSIHFSMDVYTNGALMIGLAVISRFGITWLDPVLSILVGLYILYEAFFLLRHGMRDILDEQLPEHLREEIIQLIEHSDECFVGFHNLRTRRAGSQKIMDLHLVVCRKLSLEDAHNIADALEKRIEGAIRGADVTIHLEPCMIQPCLGPSQCPLPARCKNGAASRCWQDDNKEQKTYF